MIRIRGHQAGVALITVMVVLAIVVTVAADMLRAHQRDIRQAEILLHGNEAIQHLLALETWSREVLVKDLDDGPNDDLSETWAQILMPVDADGGVVAGRVLDQQGLFNLNNLVDTKGVADPLAAGRFQLLLDAIGGFTNSSAIVEATVDWIDADSSVTGLGGREDNDYAVLDPPYRTAGTEMVSPSELLLVEGVSFKDWTRLRPFITTLPKDQGKSTSVNVNTAPAEVLQAMTKIDPAAAADIVTNRKDNPFTEVDSFRRRVEASLGEAAVEQIDFGLFSTASDYFLVESEARFGDVSLSMHHLLRRRGQQTAVLVRALGEEW